MAESREAQRAQVKRLIKKALGGLTEEEFQDFKWNLENGFKVPRAELQKAGHTQTVDLMVQRFPQTAQDVAITCLQEISRGDLVENLSLTNPGDSLQ